MFVFVRWDVFEEGDIDHLVFVLGLVSIENIIVPTIAVKYTKILSFCPKRTYPDVITLKQ